MEAAKSAIKSFVLDLRKTLEREIEVGLRRYGIAAGNWREISELRHLDDRGIAARIRMEEAIRHEMRRGNGYETEKSRAEAVHWFVREVAFTHLNRLVALKAMEVRGLIPEIIQNRPDYGNRSRAHQEFREDHSELANAPDDALEAAIKEICRQVYPEFRILFDVGDQRTGQEAPANSLLWPSYPVLKDCIAKINKLDADAGRSGPPSFRAATPEESFWAEDEIIGWIYQFCNAEEKVAIRKKGKPKRPAEVAVINQFFTPRWIVKYLVDNTLGRLWLEMHPNSPRVRAKCDYLVPEPIPASEDSENEEERFIPDPDSPINHPHNPPRRKAKRPQDIRLIDPACGTMHFGHYAFEVFQEIYADAHDQGWVLGPDTLPDEDVPTAILKYNLYGVDIDLRAVQLAALSLFIKAKTANQDAHIERVNLVVADAYLPEGPMQEEFLKQYAGEPVIQKAFREVFDSLNNVAEVGSLLRVEERFRQILGAANHPAVNGQKKKTPQQIDFDDVSPTWSPTYTIEQMLNQLKEFTRLALAEHDINAQIFADETKKSVALLDVFLRDYDTVVMNPPYGGSTTEAEIYLNENYDNSKDLFAMFVERGLTLVNNDGFVGALTSSTFLRYKAFQKYRENVLLGDGKLITFTDLGWGVLDDAQNVTAAYVLAPRKKINEPYPIVFYRLCDDTDKKTKFQQSLSSDISQQRYIVPENNFRLLPNTPLCYYTSRKFLDKCVSSPLLQSLAYVCAGAAVHKLFHRQWWEIKKTNIGLNKDWVRFTIGAGYSPFHYDFDRVVFWKDDGKRVIEYTLKRYPYLGNNPSIRIQNTDRYFNQGLGYNVRGERFSVQPISATMLFSDKGQAIFPNKNDDYWFILGYLNSSVVDYYLSITCDLHKNYTYVRQTPILSTTDVKKDISDIAFQAWFMINEWDKLNETNFHFDKPSIVKAIRGKIQMLSGKAFRNDGNGKILSQLLAFLHKAESELNSELIDMQSSIDKFVFELFNISEYEQSVILSEIGHRLPPIVWPNAKRFSKKQKNKEHISRLFSYLLLDAIKSDLDGIIPITEGTGHDNVLNSVRHGLEKEFGDKIAYQIESDAKEYLGRSVEEWLEKDFWKNYHIKWYKRRPIIWQIQSPNETFSCFVYIQKLNKDTLSKLRTQYLWPVRNSYQSELNNALGDEWTGKSGAASRVADLEAKLDDLADFEQRLLDVIEGRVECDIPDWAEGPYRNGVYDPVIDDGVAVNILPLQEASLLPKKVV